MAEHQLSLALGPNVTTCAHCGDLVHGSDVVIKQFSTGHSTEQEHFCCDEHHYAWYINRLRSFGL